jgi:hypothetical protein
MVKELNPEGVARRKHRLNRRRGEYITPGPNYLWSIDAYCKLEKWGFQIYAGIDAYSRCIVWLYCLVTARLGASVVKQYLRAVDTLGAQPEILRSDYGSETYIVADYHFQIAQLVRKDYYNKDTGEPIAGEDISFAHAFIFGTSVANQRIECWWGEMTRGALQRWRVSLPRPIYEDWLIRVL